MLAASRQEGQLGSVAISVSLISASVLAVVFLIYVSARSLAASGIEFDPRDLFVAGVLSGIIAVAVLAALSFLRATRRAKRAQIRAAAKVEALEKSLLAAEAIFKAEPQVLIFWEESGNPHMITNGLDPSLGVPSDGGQLLKFRGWLEPESAGELESGLNGLFENGDPFNVMLKTNASAYLEADGRAAGSRLILKFRDLAGRRLELAQICDKHRKLSGIIKANRALLEAVPMPIWFRDNDGKIDWVNQAYVAVVDAPDPGTVIEQQTELLEARQREAVDTSLARGETFRERLHTIVSGERRAFDVIVVPLGSSNAGFAVDIAALETVKGDLDRHIAAHARTLDRVSTAVAIFGPDQRLTFFNQAYLDIWGLEDQWLESGPKDGEILDRLRALRFLPEQADYRVWRAKFLECYQSSEPREDWWYLPDGRSIHVVAEQRPDGGVAYLFDDATERIALESRYNSLFHVQQETLENLTEGVAVFATDGRLTLFNPAFAAIWKLNVNELKKRPHIDEIINLCSVLHDDNTAWMEFKRAVTAIHDHRQNFEGQLNRADDSIIDYACLPLPDGATLLTYVDVTDSKRVENMLIERNEALEAANRLKNDFIQNVSYELRTPLTNIIGFSDLLADTKIGVLNDKQREYLGDIRASSATLLSIINDILDLATIDAGALELNLKSVRVEEVIRSAALGVKERLVRAKLGLDIRVEQSVSGFLGDATRVTQILYNLLSNAIGFSEEGSRITLICQRDGNMIAFSIVDQGCGIPEEYHQAVFERFENRSQGSKHRGAGLGLSIVKSLAELHGGNVILRSKPGAGTSITVRFPEFGPRSARLPASTPIEVDANSSAADTTSPQVKATATA